MISGIMPCSEWVKRGYPWELAIRTWARVCDEIVVVVHGRNEANTLFHITDSITARSQQEGRKCEVMVRAVQDPPLTGFGGYGSYLFYGTCLASEPDWMLAIEADYLISPDEATKLRQALIGAPADMEIVLANAVTLNYDGTAKVYNPDFKNNFPPNDGFTWHRPIGSRPKRGVFPVPFGGIDRNNIWANCEGFICLAAGRWGSTFNSKFLNENPFGLNLLRTDVRYEHLAFTKNHALMRTKLAGQYFQDIKVGVKEVVEGNEPYPFRYAELDEIAKRYPKNSA